MKLLSTLLTGVKIKGALLFPRVTLSEAQATSIALVKAGHIRIPRGYLSFLEYSDGFAWGDLELFCCGVHERAGTVFNQPELLAYQQKYATGHFFKQRLVLGRATESLICYNAQNKCYELIVRDGLQVMLKFPRFEDLLYQLVA